ncbi:MAG: peptidylprolyl isomerase, partial [Phycisphaerae bacterium]|nr:peptidylprolyl isomerase [Phycisphaerae bacterium]
MGQQCAPEPGEPNVLPPAVNQPQVTLHTNQGDIVIELFMHQAPTAAANFLHYLQEGYYDDAIFHDTDSAGIAGGEVTTSLSPKAPKPLVNESNNGLANLRGRVALYGAEGVASGVPSFIINLEDNPSLDYSLAAEERVAYTVIGRVVQGMSVAKAIGAVDRTSRGEFGRLPTTPVSVNDPDLAITDYLDPDDPDDPDDPTPSVFSLSEVGTYAAGTGPNAMVYEDFDGDGSTDLAVAASGANQVVILVNDGNGVFSAS